MLGGRRGAHRCFVGPPEARRRDEFDRRVVLQDRLDIGFVEVADDNHHRLSRPRLRGGADALRLHIGAIEIEAPR